MESLQNTLFRVEVKTTARAHHYWGTNETLSDETKQKVAKADVLLVPWDFTRDNTGPTFPAGTGDFYKLLKLELSDYSIEIASDVGTYHEIDLHSDVKRYTKIVVSYIMLPVVLGTIGSLLANEINGVKPPTSVEISIVVDAQDGRCIDISYKGPPNELAKTVLEHANRCLPPKPNKRKKENSDSTEPAPTLMSAPAKTPPPKKKSRPPKLVARLPDD